MPARASAWASTDLKTLKSSKGEEWERHLGAAVRHLQLAGD
jgi:hypothetical protein